MVSEPAVTRRVYHGVVRSDTHHPTGLVNPPRRVRQLMRAVVGRDQLAPPLPPDAVSGIARQVPREVTRARVDHAERDAHAGLRHHDRRVHRKGAPGRPCRDDVSASWTCEAPPRWSAVITALGPPPSSPSTRARPPSSGPRSSPGDQSAFVPRPVVMGSHMVRSATGQDVPNANFMVTYLHLEEKGSDVNVASHLLLALTGCLRSPPRPSLSAPEVPQGVAGSGSRLGASRP